MKRANLPNHWCSPPRLLASAPAGVDLTKCRRVRDSASKTPKTPSPQPATIVELLRKRTARIERGIALLFSSGSLPRCHSDSQRHRFPSQLASWRKPALVPTTTFLPSGLLARERGSERRGKSSYAMPWVQGSLFLNSRANASESAV